MIVQIVSFIVNIFLLNLGFLFSFLIRYGIPFPENNFLPYKNSFVFLTLIYLSALAVFGVYKSRFKSSWELFKRVFDGLFFRMCLNPNS